MVPLDGFYLALLLLGAALMLFGGLGERAEVERDATPETPWQRFFAGLRLGISLALLSALVWWAIVR